MSCENCATLQTIIDKLLEQQTRHGDAMVALARELQPKTPVVIPPAEQAKEAARVRREAEELARRLGLEQNSDGIWIDTRTGEAYDSLQDAADFVGGKVLAEPAGPQDE